MATDAGIAAFPLLSEARKLFDDRQFDAAAKATMAHLRQNPEEPRGLGLLGCTAMRLGALGQAEHFLRKALAKGNRSLEVKRALASVVNQQERLVEAEGLFGLLEREDPDPALPSVRAIILDKLGRDAEATELREKLARDNPNLPFYWIAYGHSLRAAGQVVDAEAAYRRAISADDECGEAWWGLASIKKKILSDDDLAKMEEMSKIAIDVQNSAPLHFAIARALHDRGRYEEAFRHYSEGNKQRAESIGYNQAELTNEVAEFRANIDANFMATLSSEQHVNGPTPIFIVCLPRSGSTLLEQMLGSHPAIEPIGELPYIPAILRSVMEMATRGGPITVPQMLRSLPDQAATAMGADYLNRLNIHRKSDCRFVVDKLPHNWSNILFIKRILPNAKFLDIRRNPMDCCFSNFSQSFSNAHSSSFALDDIGQCYVDYVSYMEHLDAVAPGLVHHISYENLVADAETNLRRALDYLGLDWDPSLLEFHKLDRVVRTPSSEQVRRPLNRDGIDVWRNYEAWLGPLKRVLGPLAT